YCGYCLERSHADHGWKSNGKIQTKHGERIIGQRVIQANEKVGRKMSQQMEDIKKSATDQSLKWVGKAVKRIDGPEKVTGEQKYMTDYHYPDMVWGKVLRSKYPFAKIRSIDTSKAEAHPDVVCVL